MIFSGFSDEAAGSLEGQIKATKELGWSNIETRKVDYKEFIFAPEEDFDRYCQLLNDAGVSVHCFGSAVSNWAKNIVDPPDSSYEEMKMAIPRMKRLGTKYIRIMSFKVPPEIKSDDQELGPEIIKRVKHIVKMAEDGGVVCLHENCMNFGGRSYEHTLRLLDEIQSPSFRLVFDTGNPVGAKDIRGEGPYTAYQDSLEFYNNVKEFVDHIHIKDGKVVDGKLECTMPGEGDGHVPEILADLFKRGYDGAISIEPHVAVVFHDDSVTAKDDEKYRIYVEYGKQMEKLCAEAGWKI